MNNQIKELPIATEALRASYGTAAILPIEFFKLHAETLRGLIPTPIVRSFLSSGTTRADRSQSHFSEEGLAVYRQKSVAGFQDILGYFFKEPLKSKGLSLIPPVMEWPDSSLAQMVHWIGEEHDLQYWDGLGAVPQEPVWVFGTAFHFVNLADDGVRVQLPKGSVVIETGGTKGRSRSVTRDELYTLIAEHLGVPKNRIISEYGMCELASQAYDFVPEAEGPEWPLAQRWFRFPAVTNVRVRDRLSAERQTGEGTLVVYDSLRIDYPWPIRTEDMARVREDGAFQLIGRVPMSPLKGCSMLAEAIAVVPDRANVDRGRVERMNSTAASGPALLQERAERIHAVAQNLLSDESFWDLWRNELEHTRAADWLREDLASSLPSDTETWVKAAQIADGGISRWLIIPPETHSFAWLYPVLLGSVLGYELHLRARSDDRLVAHVKELVDFTLWGAEKRIGADPLPPVDTVMIYGSDETIAAVRKICPVPVLGFGTSLALSVFQDGDAITDVWKDAFSLLQKGCMSSRVVFTLETNLPAFTEAPVGLLPLGLELALEHGAFALRCQGVAVAPRPFEGAPLLVFRSFDPQQSLADLLLDRALGLTVVQVPKKLWPTLAEWLPAQQNLHKISVRGNPVPLDAEHLEQVPPGKANAPAWNGLHQNRALFEYNKQDEKAESKGQEI